MPQATDVDRARYKRLFGDIGAEHGVAALKNAGYRLTRSWCWKRAKHEPTGEDLFLIRFLIDEWDFGGLEGK